MSSQAQAAAAKNIMKLDPDREGVTVIVCGVKIVNKLQALMQMLPEVVKVNESGVEVIEAAKQPLRFILPRLTPTSAFLMYIFWIFRHNEPVTSSENHRINLIYGSISMSNSD